MDRTKEVLDKNHTEDSQDITETKVTKKSKSRAGRKPGYRMESWQKEIQMASVRNKDLECFNLFFGEFVEVCCQFVGQVFYLPPESGERGLFYDDRLFVLREAICREGKPPSSTKFFFRSEAMSWKKLCLGAFDLYVSIRDKKLFPVEEMVRADLYDRIGEIATREGLKFHDQKVIGQNLSSTEIVLPEFEEGGLPGDDSREDGMTV